MSAQRLSELDKGERRRAWLHTVAVLAVAWVVLVGVYYLVPTGVVPASRSGADSFLRLGAGVALFAAILAGQARRIIRAELPELRAVEALGVVIPLFLVVFAAGYLSLSHSSAAMFTERLDHTRALYFTITVFSTVGSRRGDRELDNRERGRRTSAQPVGCQKSAWPVTCGDDEHQS